jgi:hypothetical protein
LIVVFYLRMEQQPQLHLTLHSALQHPGEFPESVDTSCIEGTYFWGALVAGHLLRMGAQKPELQSFTKLANRALTADQLTEPSAQLLKGIINSSLDRYANGHGFMQRTSDRVEDVCHLSELHFVSTLRDLGRPSGDFRGARLIGEPDNPLLLQKFKGINTALSLQELIIDGVTFPAGSIMGVDLKRDFDAHKGKYAPIPPKNSFTIVPPAEIDHMTFLRPSLFALAPEVRGAYIDAHALELDEDADEAIGAWPDDLIDDIEDTTLDQIRRTLARFSITETVL